MPTRQFVAYSLDRSQFFFGGHEALLRRLNGNGSFFYGASPLWLILTLSGPNSLLSAIPSAPFLLIPRADIG
jgi:uncharacterized membrane protein